jgi:very-short-patch-repair endonuclease
MLYRFGPVSQQGGERRLNVAITRARNRMTIVSSFASSDMDPTRLHSEGPQMLQRYLQYAESSGSNLGHHAKAKSSMNPFERDVFTELTAAGLPLVPQVGTSGYWIDFGAQHPTKPGRMVLAIETDGAMYHSTPTARDRDRLRQEHLERLGWTFHRIWSTSWFRNREVEIQLAREAYDRAVRWADGDEVPDRPDGPTPVPPSSGADAESAPSREPRPRVPRGLAVTDYSDRQLVAMVKWVESDTLLRTDDELLQAVMDELGFERRGARIVAAISAAIRKAHAR